MSLQKISGRYAIAAQEDRSAPRNKTRIPVRLRLAGGRAVQTELVDLSLSGFAALSPSRMHIGTLCWLTLPGLEALQAEVIWWQDGLCGCAFANLLSPIVKDNILVRYRATAEC